MKSADRGTGTPPRGLAGWMARVLVECERAGSGFTPEAVHDLRVALRRCRTMADSLAGVDDNPGWAAAKRSGKKLFRSLGDLRDVQVMTEWTLRLGGPGDPVRLALLARVLSREEPLRDEAVKALRRFSRPRWKTLARRLAARSARFREDGDVFEELARQRLSEAWELHRKASARPSPAAWHRLRIGVKRFRYVVENFLPTRHAEWGRELKRIQDLLGDVHDLDVLRRELSAVRRDCPEKTLVRWRLRIESERELRLEEYRRMALERHSVWTRWRSSLADGRGAGVSATAKPSVARIGGQSPNSKSNPDGRTADGTKRMRKPT